MLSDHWAFHPPLDRDIPVKKQPGPWRQRVGWWRDTATRNPGHWSSSILPHCKNHTHCNEALNSLTSNIYDTVPLKVLIIINIVMLRYVSQKYWNQTCILRENNQVEGKTTCYLSEKIRIKKMNFYFSVTYKLPFPRLAFSTKAVVSSCTCLTPSVGMSRAVRNIFWLVSVKTHGILFSSFTLRSGITLFQPIKSVVLCETADWYGIKSNFV